jgi:hypothetical protein
MSPYAVNMTITNSSGQTYLEEVDQFKRIEMNQMLNFSSPYRTWAVTVNYLNDTPREITQIAFIGSTICPDELQEFSVTYYSDASKMFPSIEDHQVLVFSNTTLYIQQPGNAVKLEDFLRSGGGIVALGEELSVWKDSVFLSLPNVTGFHPTSEFIPDSNLTSGIYFNSTVPTNLPEVVDKVSARTPGDLISMYGLNFRTFVQNKMWIISEFDNTHIRVLDLSEGDDFADLVLNSGENKYLTGFENDYVKVEASRPVWTISGDLGGYTWLQGSHLIFPSFGSFAVIAPKSTTISIAPTNSSDYVNGNDFEPTTVTLAEGEIFRVNKTHDSGFRWISLNSTLPVIVETWSDHGMIQKLAKFNGEKYETMTAGVGNITICAREKAVSFGDEIYLSSRCSEVEDQSDVYTFISDADFLMVQSLGGDEASQIIHPQAGDDDEASAIAQVTDSDLLEQDSPTGSYNLFYIYRAGYPVNLPSTRKGAIILFNPLEVFNQFGVEAIPVSSGCVDWMINLNTTLFYTPNNVTEKYLEANPFEGCTFFHTVSGETNFASSPDHDLERIVDFKSINGEPFFIASLKPYRTKQLSLLENLQDLVSENIFTSDIMYSWEFGSPVSSVGAAKRQEITLRIPIAVYYNETMVKPGELELKVFDGELEKIRGAIERSCLEDVDEVMEMRITAPMTLNNQTLCQSGACSPLLCSKEISLDLNAGFRIIKVSSNETGVFIG